VKSELTLPEGASENGELDADSMEALIAQLAEELSIDPKYIVIGDPGGDGERMRALASGLSIQITILSDGGGEIAARLAELTSSEEFWNGVNDKLEEANATALVKNVSALVTGGGLEVETAEATCNAGFEFDDVTSTCLAVAMKCWPGTYAAAGAGQCIACPGGRFSGVEGAYACERCMPGAFALAPEAGSGVGATNCKTCSRGMYQPRAGQFGCSSCPAGKYMNDRGASLCREVSSSKMYIAVVQGQSQEVECPVSGISAEVKCGSGLLSFKTEGFFHDGLVPSSSAGTEWAHRDGYTADKGTLFYSCPHPSACVVDEAEGNLSCASGSYGMLCATCQQGHYRLFDATCESCEKVSVVSLVFFLLIAVAIGGWWCKIKIQRKYAKRHVYFRARWNR
jgi:hypothetical protein